MAEQNKKRVSESDVLVRINEFMTWCDDRGIGVILGLDVPGSSGGMVCACGSNGQLAPIHLKLNQLAMHNFEMPEHRNHHSVFRSRAEMEAQRRPHG